MSNFSKTKVFTNSIVNAVLDRLYYETFEAFPDITIGEALALSGAAAAIIQGKQAGNCRNVVLVTNSMALHLFFQERLPKLMKNNGVLKFRERTIFYFHDFALEIWFTSGDIGILDLNGLDVQVYSKINPLCL